MKDYLSFAEWLPKLDPGFFEFIALTKPLFPYFFLKFLWFGFTVIFCVLKWDYHF